MSKKVLIIDYGVGNILSIKNAIEFNGHNANVSKNPQEIENSTHIILPGVGAFPSAMKKLKDLELIKPIKNAVQNNSKLLGICLGMQLLFSSSEEFENTDGLNLIPGEIIKINKFSQQKIIKLPNIGWRHCEIKKESTNIEILKEITNKDEFYFVHSYMIHNFEENLVVTYSNYENIKIPAIIKFDNIYGCQFHPEKSGSKGLLILKNFLNL